MKKSIHRYDWNGYSFSQVSILFNENFQEVTCYPDNTVFQDLRTQQRATIELLENRSSSTLYRIKELGQCYLVSTIRETTVFDNYESYLNAPPQDHLLEQFTVQALTFSVEPQLDGTMRITRNKHPKFQATYIPNDAILTTGDVNLVNETWESPEPENEQKEKIRRKLAIFLKKYTTQPAN